MVECNKMRPCCTANGGNNVDVSATRLRKGFCMPCNMKIRSAKCRSHQRFAVRHIMSKGFQNYISLLEKKIRQSSLVSFRSFCNCCKKIFFNVNASKLAAYAKQLLLHSKGAMCCILPRGIVWMHLKTRVCIALLYYFWIGYMNCLWITHNSLGIEDMMVKMTSVQNSLKLYLKITK